MEELVPLVLTRLGLALLAYALGAVLLRLWLGRRPVRSIREAFLAWWAGTALIVLPKVALIGLSRMSPAEPATGSLPGILSTIVQWAGGMLLLRALVSLVFWEHRQLRARALFGVAIALALLLSVLVDAAAPILVVPWILCARWRHRLTTGQLGLAAFTFLASLFLITRGWGPLAAPSAPTALSGLEKVTGFSIGLAWLYALVGLSTALLQIPFSYRRIRGRFVLSHLLAGLLPVALAAAIGLGVTTVAFHIQRERTLLTLYAHQNRTMEARLRELVPRLSTLALDPAGLSSRETILARGADGEVRRWGQPLAFAAESLLVHDLSTREAPSFFDGHTLFARARIDTVLAAGELRLEGLQVVDSVSVASLSRIVGAPVQLVLGQMGAGFSISSNAGIQLQLGTTAASGVPLTKIGASDRDARGMLGLEELPCLLRTATGWRVEKLIMLLTPLDPWLGIQGPTRGSDQAKALAISVIVLVALYGLVVLGLAHMVWRMGRTTLEPVTALTRATGALGSGRLDHRIEVAGDDELWSVASSFNQMTKDLGRLRAVELHTQRLEEELRLAHEIQARLLPGAPPVVPGVDLAGLSLPAREVGGDYFDFLTFPDGRVGLVIADVSGKGVPAALLMSAFRAALRTQDLPGLGPAQVLSRLNSYIHASVDPGKFITAFLALLDPNTGELRYANAGHDAPLMVHRNGSQDHFEPGGLMLGILPQIAYPEGVTRMPQGSLLFAFTDGITEAQNVAGDFFGEEELIRQLMRLRDEKSSDLLSGILDQVRGFAGEMPQFDDITMLLAMKV